MTYQYECEAGHWIEAERRVVGCPACVRGVPCPAPLKRVGPGSKKEKTDA